MIADSRLSRRVRTFSRRLLCCPVMRNKRRIWLERVGDYPTPPPIRGKLEDERAKLRKASDTMTTLTSYIDRHFFPDVEARLRPSTLAGYRGLLDRYL